LRVEGDELLLFLEAFANKGGLETELPNCEKDVIEELQTYTPTETGFTSTANGASTGEEG
jgi:hypothetical protein